MRAGAANAVVDSPRMSYTIRNLAETEDIAPKFGFGELGEAHFPREELDASETGLAYQVLKPASAARSATATRRPRRSTS